MPALIPLNYPNSQAEAQVAQFIEGTQTSLFGGLDTVLDTIAECQPSASTVTFLDE